jgi:hypothetical protein
MKRLIPFLIFLSPFLFHSQLSAQDTLFTTQNKTILADVIEIGTDEIKYKPYDDPDSPIFVIEKVKVSKLTTQEGKEYTFINSFDDPELYIGQNKNALKFGLFSPLLGNINFTYERSLKPGRSMEFALGIIGIGVDDGSDARGAFVKAGYKFINTPDFYLKGMRYSHLLKGFYVKPELIISTFVRNEYSYYGYNESTSRQTVFAAAAVLNIGKQWVFSDVFLIDLFFGAGFGISSDGENWERLYGFMGGYNRAPFAITGGFRIGFLFK